MDAIKVQAEQLATLSSRLLRSARRIDAVLADLDGQLLALSRQWSGSASSAYHDAQHRWQQAMSELHEELAVASRRVDAMRDAYAEAAQQVAEIWADPV